MIQRSIIYVRENTVERLNSSQISIESVGGKAFGLCSIPKAWSTPFFVISKEFLCTYCSCDDKATKQTKLQIIKKAIHHSNISGDLILRSSAIDEGMNERGRFESLETNLDRLEESLDTLLSKLNSIPTKGLHIVVQQLINARFTGHMSNERRFSKDSRDWKLELYYQNGTFEQDTLAIRAWRTKFDHTEIISAPLSGSKRSPGHDLQKVAFYWYELSKEYNCRYHLEFVFDGLHYYIVQADRDAPNPNAISPKQIDIHINASAISWKPEVLHIYDPKKPSPFRKLLNVKQYYDLGFCTVPLYYLDDSNALQQIKHRIISAELRKDIESLLNIQPLVIRMDVVSSNQQKRQMLPRSNELHSFNDVVTWLHSNIDAILGEDPGILIFHNFVPAISSAFAHAIPNGRIVKIQSLWGLPEGLYYNYHDTIIVDLGTNNVDSVSESTVKLTIKRKYKNTFIIPEKDGSWVSKELMEPFDWNCSIEKKEAILEIATKTQRLSNATQQEISVMWFVGIDDAYYGASNLPWYHEEISIDSSYTPDQYKRKYFSDEELIITNSDELRSLITSGKINGKRCFRLKPTCEKDLRNKALIESIGELSLEHDISIILDGTQLTHSYYQLKKAGAHVVCSNTDELIYSDLLEFHKLVRDRIPERIISNGEQVRCSKIGRPLLDRMLLEKMLEEAYEVYDATSTEEIVSELSDMLELHYAIQAMNKDMSFSCQDMLKNYSGSEFEQYACIDTVGFSESIIQAKRIHIGTLCGYLNVKRQKTQYRIEFSIHNGGYKPKNDVKTMSSCCTELLLLKKALIRDVSNAIRCSNAYSLSIQMNRVFNRMSLLCIYLGKTIEEVNEKRKIKRQKNGGFEEGYILYQTSLRDALINDDRDFNPNNCPVVYYLKRDNNKYYDYLQDHTKKHWRAVFRFSMPIAVNEWEITFSNSKIQNVLCDTDCIKFTVKKGTRGKLYLSVQKRISQRHDQLSLFDQ